MPQQRSEETREKILSAALVCFSRAGYDATGVAEICAAAGVSKGAFYHHFPSKQAIFIALLNDWLAGLDAQLDRARQVAGTVPEALRQMAREARSVFKDARGQLPMFLEFWTQSARDSQLWELTVQPYRRYEDYFAALIRAGVAEGSLRTVDPRVAARLLIGSVIGLLVQSLANPNETDWGELLEQSVALLLAGIETGKA